MERIAMRDLIRWNESKRRKPLIVWGARQVGKTYLVRNLFAETYYKGNYIYIDCKKEETVRTYCEQTADAGKIIEYISLRVGKKIADGTLLIFDEGIGMSQYRVCIKIFLPGLPGDSCDCHRLYGPYKTAKRNA